MRYRCLPYCTFRSIGQQSPVLVLIHSLDSCVRCVCNGPAKDSKEYLRDGWASAAPLTPSFGDFWMER